MATDIGHTASVAFATTGYNTFIAEITNISWDGISRASIPTSHMQTSTAHTFIPSDLYDPGNLALELNFDQDALPPITAAAEAITVTVPEGGTVTATWVASGFVTDFSWNAPDEDKMTATCGIKFTGEVGVG